VIQVERAVSWSGGASPTSTACCRTPAQSRVSDAAVAATVLTAAYYILRDGVSYRELGPDHFVERDRPRVAERLARRIRELGYEVTIRQAA
jgi:hypothetical protein